MWLAYAIICTLSQGDPAPHCSIVHNPKYLLTREVCEAANAKGRERVNAAITARGLTLVLFEADCLAIPHGRSS